jgi:hypothetical protein
LTPTHIDGKNPRRSALQKAIRESSGRSPHIEANPPRRIDSKALQGRLQLETSPSDESLFFGEGENIVTAHRSAGLVGGRTV